MMSDNEDGELDRRSTAALNSWEDKTLQGIPNVFDLEQITKWSILYQKLTTAYGDELERSLWLATYGLLIPTPFGASFAKHLLYELDHVAHMQRLAGSKILRVNLTDETRDLTDRLAVHDASKSHWYHLLTIGKFKYHQSWVDSPGAEYATAKSISLHYITERHHPEHYIFPWSRIHGGVCARDSPDNDEHPSIIDKLECLLDLMTRNCALHRGTVDCKEMVEHWINWFWTPHEMQRLLTMFQFAIEESYKTPAPDDVDAAQSIWVIGLGLPKGFSRSSTVAKEIIRLVGHD